MATLTAHPAFEAHKIAVKIFVEQGSDLDFSLFVPVFHSWIQQQSVAGHLLVDVASYAHVQDGPGILLISHEANIGIDEQGGRRGLLYFRKTPLAGSFEERVSRVLADAWSLARKLEAEPSLAGKLRFNTGELSIRIHDRLRAPNTAETYEALQALLEQAAGSGLGAKVQLERVDDPAKLFEVIARRA